jgi:peptidyl-tRNA hydrolase
MRLLSRRTYAPLVSLLSHRHLSSHCSRTPTTRHFGSMSEDPAPGEAPPKNPPVICQYIFLRKDLEDWPAGAMAAQAAHASVAAIVEATAAGHEATATYVNAENLGSMTKLVYGVENLGELERVREVWNALTRSTSMGGDSATAAATEAQGGDCLRAYWWVEQPENIPTAIATWPIVRTNKVSKVIKNLKLHYF